MILFDKNNRYISPLKEDTRINLLRIGKVSATMENDFYTISLYKSPFGIFKSEVQKKSGDFNEDIFSAESETPQQALTQVFHFLKLPIEYSDRTSSGLDLEQLIRTLERQYGFKVKYR